MTQPAGRDNLATMKPEKIMTALVRNLNLGVLVLVAVLVAAGCSKKSENQTVPTPVNPGAPSAPTVSPQAFDQSLTEADAAARSGACMKAFRTLQALENQPLTPDQAQRLRSQFGSLKNRVAEVIAREPYNQDALEAMNIINRQKR